MTLRIAQIVRMVALGLWVGAMVGFAFVVAPIVFHALGPSTQFAGIIAGIINAIGTFGYACGAVALGATAILFRSQPRASTAIVILVALMLLGNWYEGHAIVPLMAHTPLQTPGYVALHHRSSELYAGILLAGLAAWLMGVWRDG